jgi:SAM-dependent methyltransferase
MSSVVPSLFDRALVSRHIARAKPRFADHRALFDDIAEQLSDRIKDVRTPFHRALDLSPFPFLADGAERSFSVETLTDPTDDERLPFDKESFDLIVSNLDLHWANDLPGVLMQCRALLQPGGMFLGSLIGGDSLPELRACLMEAELDVMGGASPRFSPTVDIRTAGDLLRRAGFSLPVADTETVTLLYSDIFALMRDLRGMGQTNAHAERLRVPTPRAVFFKADELYRSRYRDAEGYIPATFEIIYLHGWA